MASNCDNHFLVNDVISLRTRGLGSDSEWAELRKIAEDQDTDDSYRRMLGIILAKADQRGERESNNNRNGGGGLHIKCGAGASGSKSKPKRLPVEKSGSPLDKNFRGSSVRDLRIRKPDRIITRRSSPEQNPGVDRVNKSRAQNCRKHKGKSADVKAESLDETDNDVAISIFRKRLLDVLGQPFDLIELQRLRRAVRAGLYYKYHPDLESELNRRRYERGRYLNILRGLFFWIQNVAQEGAFKPWLDGQCLAVEPPFCKCSSQPPSPNSAPLDQYGTERRVPRMERRESQHVGVRTKPHLKRKDREQLIEDHIGYEPFLEYLKEESTDAEIET